MGNMELPAGLDPALAQRIEELIDRKVEERIAALLPKKKPPSMTIIATKGTLDWAYPPFILASTAASLGWDVTIFFTFYGLNLLRKDLSTLKVSPLGNPGSGRGAAPRSAVGTIRAAGGTRCRRRPATRAAADRGGVLLR